MGFFLLLYVFCCYIRILQLPTTLFNYLVGNWHNVLGISLLLDLFILFDYLFGNNILLIVFFLVLNAFDKSSMNYKANWDPLLLKIFCGTLCIFQILSWYILMISSNEALIIITLSWIIFVNQSIISTILFLSFDLGNGPIILILSSYYSPSSISNRWSSLAFFMCYTLFCWHFIYP